jgi:hypothetical protein
MVCLANHSVWQIMQLRISRAVAEILAEFIVSVPKDSE